MTRTLAVTRVINACVLLELGGDFILTDPYFEERWFMRMREPIGVRADALPRLTAILGGHGVFDHFQPASLRAYPFKDRTAVYVATESMAERAGEAGFRRTEVLGAGEHRQLSASVTLEVACRESAFGMSANSYVLTYGGLRIFVGTEACALEPIAEYRATRPPVDVALLPIDGSTLLGKRLVMDHDAALEAARILGAEVLVPFHYANRALWPLLRTPGSVGALLRSAHGASTPEVVVLQPGERRVFEPRGAPVCSG